MQRTKHGIPVNIPQGFNPRKKVQVVKKVKENPFKHFAELIRMVNGLEVSIIGPVGTKEYHNALKEGFRLVHEWTIN